MQGFILDEQLASSCFLLGHWHLSTVLLKNTCHYPWLILVPRRINVTEISQLCQTDRHALIDEIASLSSILENYFKPTKVNVGSLGNIVSQLHVHLVARFKEDVSWPFGIWQKNSPADEPYPNHSRIQDDLSQLVGRIDSVILDGPILAF